ncbi:CtsR family transcriptional regulator [Bacillota bacterium LX-D]|nr:CtsR family transcriptional regulator [Bacillota bacterium LX-D]
MGSLVDAIEAYIKYNLEKSPTNYVELQRSELALKFACVPSQINYVLSTRFTVEQGYLVESRRGGGGYLRIVKLPINQDEHLYRLINESIGKIVNQAAGEGLIKRLLEEGFLTKREGMLMKAIIKNESIPLEGMQRDLVRANLLRVMLLTILREEFQE